VLVEKYLQYGVFGGVLDSRMAAARLCGERAQISLQRRHEGHLRLLLRGSGEATGALGVRVWAALSTADQEREAPDGAGSGEIWARGEATRRRRCGALCALDVFPVLLRGEKVATSSWLQRLLVAALC
jgi:hypothetical protein